MITPRRSEDRGFADHGWLQAHHTFSFAEYRDREFNRFSNLRVLNQDVVQPGMGFGTHGHQDMEIVSWVLEGVLEHKDSMGNGSQLRPGEVQFMSAGSGVTHSEFNASPDERMHMLQMWVFPERNGTESRYDQRPVPEAERRGRLKMVVSPDEGDGVITIGADARLYVGLLDGDESCSHALAPGRWAWLHVPRGSLTVNGVALGPGDGAAIRDESSLAFSDGEDAEMVLWELPAE